MTLKQIATLDNRPFRHFIMTIGELPTVYLESMTYYEMLAWFCQYLKEQVIPAVNNNAEAVQELQELFTELKTYVDTYFDNLDVQEEINNKLDNMVESGEFQDILEEYFGGELIVAFPDYNANAIEASGQDTNGDCTIFKTHSGKVFVIDTMLNETNFVAIQRTMQELGITKIDYFLISHYHIDHYGNLQHFIQSYDCTNCTFLIPRVTNNPNVGDVATNGFNSVSSLLSANNLTYQICDNQTLTLDNAEFKIFNASQADYDFIDATGTSDYNNYSICTEITCKDKRIFTTGDIEKTVMERLANLYMTGNYAIMKDAHHGMQTYTINFARLCNPEYLIVPSTKAMFTLNTYAISGLIGYLQTVTDNVFITGYQDSAVIFKINNYGVNLISKSLAYPHIGMYGWGANEVYIDSNTTSLRRDGTETYPYKTLREAIALTNKEKTNYWNYNIINSDPDDELDVLISKLKRIAIRANGNTLPRLRIEYCEDVVINNAIIDGKNKDNAVYVAYSNSIQLGSNTTIKNAKRAIEARNSEVKIFDNFTIDNISLNPLRFIYSTFEWAGGSFNATNLGADIDSIVQSERSFINSDRAAFNYLKNVASSLSIPVISGFNQRFSQVTDSKYSSINRVWEGSAESGTINFAFNIASFSYLRVAYKNSASCVNEIRVPIIQNGYFNCIPFFHYTNASINSSFLTSCRCVVTPTGMTIERNGEQEINNNGTISTGGGKIQILSVQVEG